ncbi:LacI family transcriptional regulator [Christiangramia salexigens]|uniref:LacI family transcriptional regulator n=1 Tax=Christiangramia salexigens TaxID=1913577 RepID=A0A1L3J228_9FLAO|nr:LacI family transcriptional regulator [Christiangramia salexigens]APG59170.1 hypothetical protein LPB144_01555 [Christiangramia salexigens]
METKVTLKMLAKLLNVSVSKVSKALYGMESKASELGYKIIISLSRETQAKMQIDHLKEVLNYNIPLVLFHRILSIIPCDKVSINDSLQAELATVELLDSGCSKVAYLTGISDPSVDDQRKSGYLTAI